MKENKKDRKRKRAMQVVVVLLIAAVPLGKKAVEWLRKKAEQAFGSRGLILQVGLEVAEKLFLAAIFILSVANIVDASYNPFLYFRF